MDDKSILENVTVIDLGQGAAGPLCTSVLGDFGAEIIKIEPPNGDWGRTLIPLIDGESAVFMEVNRNKKSVVIDLKTNKGLELLKKLIERADVLVETFRPGVMSRLGLDYEVLKKMNSKIIYCSISAYGQTGPWKNKPGVDGIIQATSGLMSTLGFENLEPIKVPNPIADFVSGMVATQGILLSLFERLKSGVGQRVDVNLFDSALLIQKFTIAAYLATNILPKKIGSKAPYSCPNEAYETKDGYIMLAAYSPTRWQKLCEIIGKPELISDERFKSNEDRINNRSSIKSIIEEVLKTRDTEHWCKLFEGNDLICAPIYSYKETFNLEQVDNNQILKKINHSRIGEYYTIEAMPILEKKPGKAITPSPVLGQHTEEILLSCGLSKNEIIELERANIIKLIS